MNNIKLFSRKEIILADTIGRICSSTYHSHCCKVKTQCKPKSNLFLFHRNDIRQFTSKSKLFNLVTSGENSTNTKENTSLIETERLEPSADADPNDTKTSKKRRSRVKRSFVYAGWNRPEAHLDTDLEKAILKGEMKCRSRPLKVIDPPETVTKTINNILKGDVAVEKYGDIGDNFKQYWDAGEKFKTYLHARKPSMEESTRKINRDRIEARVRRKFEAEVEEPLSRYNELKLESDIQKETDKLFQMQISTYDHQSKHIQYDKTAAWAYLLGRAAYDYATIYKIMLDIQQRNQLKHADHDSQKNLFQPRTLFDFGSGVGTSIWAAKEIFGEITEYFCVDSSTDMTDMAISLLTKGLTYHKLPAGYTFRLHLPRSSEITYDMVTCSHSLLHVPSVTERINIVDNLWRKTANGGYLIIVENGSNAGFQVVQEARNYLSQIVRQASEFDKIVELRDDRDNDEYLENCRKENKQETDLQGCLFSPCPHTSICPRFEFDTIPCSFDVRYRNFSLNKINKSFRENVQEGRFSYIVFKKGENIAQDSHWPRVVEPIKPMTQIHDLCRVCTNRGTLEEILLTNVNKGHKSDRLISKKLVGKYGKSLHSGDQFKVHLECGFENYEDFVKWATEKIKPESAT